MNRDEKIKRVEYFISSCMDSSGQHPVGLTYKDVAKVVSERYATQNVETVKVFFRTKGSAKNNKPYTYPEELEVGTSTIISDELLDIRTSATRYGDISVDTKDEEDLLKWVNN